MSGTCFGTFFENFIFWTFFDFFGHFLGYLFGCFSTMGGLQAALKREAPSRRGEAEAVEEAKPTPLSSEASIEHNS